MGAPTDMLVVVSTLYNHPEGLTKDELVNIFHNKLNLKKSFQGVYPKLKFGDYGFARIFNLENTQEYLQNKEKYFDKNYNVCTQREIIWPGFPFSVNTSNPKKISEGYILTESFDSVEFGGRLWEGHKVGNYIFKDFFEDIKIPKKYKNSKYSYLVRDVIDTKIKDNFDGESNNSYREIKQKLLIEVIELNLNSKTFNSIDELLKKYPEYSAERIYDFNQSTGFIYPHKEYSDETSKLSFTWIKKGDRYFLDWENFYKIINPNSNFGFRNWKHSNSTNKVPYSLTDVVLTSEAIRRRNWKVLGYNALFNKGSVNFAYSNEKTLRRYEHAVLDTEVSMDAQKNNMTNSEFLRKHLFETANFVKISYPEIKRMLKEQHKQEGISKRKWNLQKKKEKPPIELPF
jgi:hypothetical protein